MKYEISQLDLLLTKHNKQIDEFIIVCNKKKIKGSFDAPYGFCKTNINFANPSYL